MGLFNKKLSLEEILKAIEGLSDEEKAQVKAKMEQGATVEEKPKMDNEEEQVDDNGTEIPLTVTEIMPSVSGIVIVCNGGNDNSVKELIRNTVSVALGIESDCVCVTGTLLK